MQKGKQALLLHLGVCLRLCSTILLPCRCLLLLITLPHTPCTLNLFFFFVCFYLTLFIYPSHMCSLFRFPTLCEKHPSLSPPLHFFFFFSLLFLKSHPHIPQSIFSYFLSFSLRLAMLQRSCGNSGIMPVVLWPWLGGQFLGPEGCFSFCLCKLGVLGSVLDWKDEQLEGWRPVGANRGHRGHNHSKSWLPAQR